MKGVRKPKGPRRTAVADALKKARARTALEQAELGARVGVSGRTIYRWEHGRTAPRAAQLKTVAEALRGLDATAAAAFTKAVGVVLAPQDTDARAAGRRSAFESATYLAADALDVPAAKLRSVLRSWLGVL